MTDNQTTKTHDIFSLSAPAPTKEQIKSAYHSALEREKKADQKTARPIISDATPLLLAPVVLPAAVLVAIIHMPFDQFTRWINDADSRRYTFVSEDFQFEVPEIASCQAYVEQVRAQGRPFTVGEIAMIKNRQRALKITSTASIEGASIVNDIAHSGKTEAVTVISKSLSSLFSKKA